MRLTTKPIPFETLQNEMDRMLHSAFPAATKRRSLDFDLFETETTYELIADLPGLGENDIEIALEGRLLTIKAKRPTTEREGQKLLRSRRALEVEEALRFPADLDGDAVEARFDRGELTLVLPKLASQLPRKIEIKRG